MAGNNSDREEMVKRSMGIDNWRQNSKDSVMRLFDQLGGIELSQRIKMTENIPLLGRAMRDASEGVGNLNSDVVAQQAASKRSVEGLREQQIQALRDELAMPDTSNERRKEIQEEIRQAVEAAETHDQHHAERLGKVADQRMNLAAGASLVLALAYAGFKKLK